MSMGVIYVALSYILWGLFPFYFHALQSISASELLAHRIVWSVLLVFAIILAFKRTAWIRPLCHQPKVLLTFLLSSLLLASNWGIYVYAIVSNHTLEASLGYFINPLLSVALGALFLKEKLLSAQKFAVAIAALGVLWVTWQTGQTPWLGLGLAITWGFYGLVRKLAPLGALEGLTLETAVLTPIALIYLGYLHTQGTLAFSSVDVSTQWLLVAAGPVTTLPLLLFSSGVRLIPYSLVGVIQYVSPTLVFFIGLFCFGEPFSWELFLGFCLIWIAVVLFVCSTLFHKHRH